MLECIFGAFIRHKLFSVCDLFDSGLGLGLGWSDLQTVLREDAAVLKHLFLVVGNSLFST